MAIVAEMRELDRPATAGEIHKKLHKKFDGAWSLKAIEYHLSALVKTGVVEIVFGPELHFSLTESGKGFSGSDAVSACVSKRTEPVWAWQG